MTVGALDWLRRMIEAARCFLAPSSLYCINVQRLFPIFILDVWMLHFETDKKTTHKSIREDESEKSLK